MYIVYIQDQTIFTCAPGLWHMVNRLAGPECYCRILNHQHQTVDFQTLSTATFAHQPQLVGLLASRPLQAVAEGFMGRQPQVYKLVPAPSPMTKPSLSLSQGLDAFVGSSLRLERARQAINPPTPEGMTAASAPPASMRSASPLCMCSAALQHQRQKA